MTDPDLDPILDDLAAGRIDAAEAARRISEARGGVATGEAPQDEGRSDESWRAFAREETGQRAEPPAPEAADEPVATPPAAPQPAEASATAADAAPEAERPQNGPTARPRPEAGQRPADPGPRRAASDRREEPVSGRGAERVTIRSVGRRVRVVGDWSVPSVAVTGPHTLRRAGSVLEVTAEGQPVPLENFNLLKLPRSFDDLKNLGLGAELVVQVNPRFAVDAEVTGSGLSIEGVPTLGRIRVSAGAANLRGVRQAADVLVQMGGALVEGPLAEGRSRVKCESGALTVHLTEGANVTVRGTASMGRINWPGEGLGAVDEWVVGNGSGRLDVEIVMGMATVKDDSTDSHPVDGAEHSAVLCPACGSDTGGGRFCPNCGAAQTIACASCGADLPADARFCPGCGAPA